MNNFKELNEVLRHYYKEELPVVFTSKGDYIIQPTYRKRMKTEIVKAFCDGLEEALDNSLVEVHNTVDGVMLVVQNENEGCYTLELNIKVKSLDFDIEEYSGD